MKRSTILIIVIIFISVVGGGLLGFYFYINSSSVNRDQFGPQTINTGSGFGSPSVNTSVTLPGNASTTNTDQKPEIVATSSPVIPTTPMLRQLYKDPVAGFSFFFEDIIATSSPITETVVVANGTTSSTSTTVVKPSVTRLVGKKEIVQFLDRGTGHIYKTSSSSFDTDKVSNTTIPKIYEAVFTSQNNVILRGLYQETDTIQTRFATLKTLTPTSTEKTLVTQDLPAALDQVALSPNKQKTLYLQKNGKATGVISNPDGTSLVTAFSSPFYEWNIFWPSEKIIVLNTRPSAFAKGFAYTLNPTTLLMEKLVGDIAGLTTLVSPSGTEMIYSKSEAGTPNLYAFDIKSKQTINLFFRTFTDKCTWSTKEKNIVFCAVPQDIAYGDYPDAWYQGLIFFTDDIWKINTKTGESRLLARLNQLSDGTPIDVTNPTLSTNEDFLVFNNKKDLSLWGLKLPSPKVATSTKNVAATSTTPTTR